jgi:hypothetical protein
MALVGYWRARPRYLSCIHNQPLGTKTDPAQIWRGLLSLFGLRGVGL